MVALERDSSRRKSMHNLHRQIDELGENHGAEDFGAAFIH